MRSTKQIRTDFTLSTREMLAAIDSFPDEHFNTSLGDDVWSAGQVAEHLIKVEVGTLRFFTGGTRPAERRPEEKIPALREKFMDRENKLTATGPIVPDSKPKDKKKVLNKLQDTRQRLTGMIELEDLSAVLTDFDHPILGPLTRVEWLYFHIFHSKRHIRQIEAIRQQLE